MRTYSLRPSGPRRRWTALADQAGRRRGRRPTRDRRGRRHDRLGGGPHLPGQPHRLPRPRLHLGRRLPRPRRRDRDHRDQARQHRHGIGQSRRLGRRRRVRGQPSRRRLLGQQHVAEGHARHSPRRCRGDHVPRRQLQGHPRPGRPGLRRRPERHDGDRRRSHRRRRQQGLHGAAHRQRRPCRPDRQARRPRGPRPADSGGDGRLLLQPRVPDRRHVPGHLRVHRPGRGRGRRQLRSR